MKILLLTLLVASASADNYCKGVYIKDNYYNIEIIKEGINGIKELVFNRNDNKAYFTFEQIAKIPTRVLGYVNLGDKTVGLIDGIRNATGLALDQNLNRLYVGGSDGLFMINMNNKDKVPEKLPVNDDIRSIFVKNNVVYFVNKRREAYKFEFGIVKPIFEVQGIAVDKMVLDDDNNIHYLQFNNLFRVKIGTKAAVSQDKLVVNDIAVDANFKPYVCAKDGLFVYNKYKYALDRVADLKDIRKLAFVTTDAPIYVVVDTMVRLISNPVPCFGD